MQVSVRPLDLTRAPTTRELIAAGQFGGALYPTHDFTDKAAEAEINLSFGNAIQAWNRHEYKEAVEMFKEHVALYPDSPWAAEATLHVGCDAYYQGRYSEARSIFESIIAAEYSKTNVGPRMMLNKARLRLSNLSFSENDFDEALTLLRDLKREALDWRQSTYAETWIQRLTFYKAKQRSLMTCGAQALARAIKKKGDEVSEADLLTRIPQTAKGFSLSDLISLAKVHGYELNARRLSADDLRKIPLPAIVQFYGSAGSGGHYWVVDSVDNNTIALFDAQGLVTYRRSLPDFAKQWDGIALIFSSGEQLAGKALSEDDAQRIFGGCCGVPLPPDDLGDPCKQKSGGPDGAGSSPCPNDCGGSGGPNGPSGPGFGSPYWKVSMVGINFWMNDIPYWYQNTVGPSVEISLSYNAESANNYYEPFGNKWQFNYASYLVVNTFGIVTVYMPDGRRDEYSPDGEGGYTPKRLNVVNDLTNIADDHWELRLLDDTVYVYDIPPGTDSQQPFLLEIRDAYDQALTFGYTTVDSEVRLTSITDALGRVTSFVYNIDGLVERVDGPFGRSAHFEYDAGRNLTKITDMGGYWTDFTYDQGNYVSTVSNAVGAWDMYFEPPDYEDNGDNPYPPPGGVMNGNYRITITDPLGNKEEYHYDGLLGRRTHYVSPRDYIEYDPENPEYNNYSSAPKIIYNIDVPVMLSRGVIGSIFWPEGDHISYAYNAYGELLGIINDPNIFYEQYRYWYTYNEKRRITSVRILIM